MKVKTVSFVGSFAGVRSFPDARVPEIAFIGRSNVGKSSLINTLLGHRGIARTSNTPGKTRTANCYMVNDTFCFVDMPGYGYAQVSKEERAKWRRLITGYLAERDALSGVVHLLDMRHTPTEADRDMVFWARGRGRRLCLAFSKVDKVARADVRRNLAEHLRSLDVDAGTAVIAFSSETGEGRRELWGWILDALSAGDMRRS